MIQEDAGHVTTKGFVTLLDSVNAQLGILEKLVLHVTFIFLRKLGSNHLQVHDLGKSEIIE